MNLIAACLRRICRWSLLLAVIAVQHHFSAVAQDTTPLRALSSQAGVSSANQFAKQVERQSAQTADEASASNGSAESNDLVPWWEGALQKSMEQKHYQFWGNLTAGWEYDSNLRLLPSGVSPEDGSPKASGYISLQPTVGFSLGAPGSALHLDLAYGADLQWYDRGGVGDIVNHHAYLNFAWQGAKLRTTASIYYASSTGADIDVGDRVSANTVTGNFTAIYQSTPKLSFGANCSIVILDYQSDTYNSSNQIHPSVFVDYIVDPKLTVGLQAGYQSTNVGEGADQNDYDFGIRARWTPTAKLTVGGSVEADVLDYQGDGTQVETIGRLDLTYAIAERTGLSMNIYRTINPSSVLTNAVYNSTGVAFTLNQRVTEKVNFSLIGGYEFADYQGIDNTSADRRDNYWYLRPELTYAVTRRISVTSFYQYTSDDSSGQEGSSFTRNQFGIFASIAFGP